MIKRRKDGGFTLIELMIVIAVIGILAVVLAPKMAGVKDSAKATGVITNAKSVEAYVVANIDRWNKPGGGGAATAILDINNMFGADGKNVLANPLVTTNPALDVSTAADAVPTPGNGVVTVKVNSSLGTNGIEITGYQETKAASGEDAAVNSVVYTETVKAN